VRKQVARGPFTDRTKDLGEKPSKTLSPRYGGGVLSFNEREKGSIRRTIYGGVSHLGKSPTKFKTKAVTEKCGETSAPRHASHGSVRVPGSDSGLVGPRSEDIKEGPVYSLRNRRVKNGDG